VRALDAAARLALDHGLPHDELTVLKDGSNLLVHLAPSPVVLRIASFTGLIRGDPLPWLEREISLVSYLASVGASVMPPSDLVPPGPHVVGGWALTAWAFVEHERGVVPDGLTTLSALDELHVAMLGYPDELPLLNPVAEDLDLAIRFGLARGVIGAAQAADLRGRRDDLVGQLGADGAAIQAQHGDAFPRNMLMTSSGPIWIDFEDCCSGPVLWDLATLVRTLVREDGDDEVARIVRRRIGAERLNRAIELRQIQIDVWTLLHDARAKHGWEVTSTAPGTTRPRP
jgi:hypothetical protein